MTNEELKKKICEIVAPYVSAWGEDERIADALIAAGIGDVSELKKHRVVVEKSLIPEEDNVYVLPNIPPTVKQLYSGEEVEKIVKERKELKDELRSKVEYIHEQGEVIKEYKHRAEVAELVVKNLNDIFTFDYQTVFEQAEKKLAEEGEND